MRTITDGDDVVWELVECFWRPTRPDHPYPHYEYTFVTTSGRRRVGRHPHHQSVISEAELLAVLEAAVSA